VTRPVLTTIKDANGHQQSNSERLVSSVSSYHVSPSPPSTYSCTTPCHQTMSYTKPYPVRISVKRIGYALVVFWVLYHDISQSTDGLTVESDCLTKYIYPTRPMASYRVSMVRSFPKCDCGFHRANSLGLCGQAVKKRICEKYTYMVDHAQHRRSIFTNFLPVHTKPGQCTQ